MPRKWRLATLFLVFLAALLSLGFNLQNVGIASGFIDPVTRLGAQDEALYTREAIQMATGSGWLTPTFLGRFVLFKPPLLMWLSGLSMKLFGIEPLAARLPALFAGGLICAIVFAIVWRARSMPAAIAASTLLASNQLFHTMARVNMTDILLTLAVVSAFGFWLRDSRLQIRGAFWGFSVSVAAAILTKSVAGLLPLIAVALCMPVVREKPTPKRLVQVCLLIAAIVLPWHVYQFLIHRDWFLAEYLGVQLVLFGSQPPQTSRENQLWFYLLRLAVGDPVLTMLLATCLWHLRAFQRRVLLEPLPAILLSWVVTFGGALFVFQYRSVQYALPLIPVFVILAAVYSPWFARRAAGFTIPLLAIVFAIKTSTAGQPWSISFASGTTLASADPLSDYCSKHRDAELIVLLPDDEFYSAVLPLPRVRYAWIDGEDVNAKREPHLRYLGITLSPTQFDNLDRDRPLYRQRLKSWGLETSDPTGTAIVAANIDHLRAIVRSHASSDFFLPRYLLNGTEQNHTIVNATRDRVFLFANRPAKTNGSASRWTCDM